MRRITAVIPAVCLFLFCLSTIVLGQAAFGLKGVGGHLGYVIPEDPIENTIGFGAQADLGTITKDVHLTALLQIWSKSYKAGVPSYGEADWTEIVIGASAKYFFEVKSAVKPYIGGGLNFTIGRSKWEFSYLGYKYEESDSETDLGLHILGGAEYPLSPELTGFAELLYHLNGADYFGIFIGVTYSLIK